MIVVVMLVIAAMLVVVATCTKQLSCKNKACPYAK